jgi:copper chaperone CopZ
MPFRRTIQVVHRLPGRLRLRLPWLHDHREQASPLAERLSELPGMAEVEVRPYTGSVLCAYDDERLDEERILAAVCETSGCQRVCLPGQPGPALTAEENEQLRSALAEGSHVARAAARFFKEVNMDVVRASEGRIDLGTIASLFFASAGLVEVGVSKKLPLPPWFQLAWWAFRTFTTVERPAIEGTVPPWESAPEAPPSA